jgi:hypothetical protein
LRKPPLTHEEIERERERENSRISLREDINRKSSVECSVILRPPEAAFSSAAAPLREREENREQRKTCPKNAC